MSARYSRQTGYTVAKRTAPRRATRTVQRQVKLGPTTARYIGLGILGVIALAGLSRTTGTAVNGYQDSDLNAQISSTQAEVDALTLDAQRAQALGKITQDNAAKNLQPAPANVDQVAVGNVPVASPTPASSEQGKVAGVSTDVPR
jgi:hypothetical protein